MCVELPIQRLFIAFAAQKDLCMYGVDPRDAYAHAPVPEMMTHLTIDDAYFELYKEKTGKTLNRRYMLPVLHSLQRHPESGKMWTKLIDRILIKELGFKTTTKDRYIYIKKIEGRTLLLLHQVDDFYCACTVEQDAKNSYNLIGTKIQFKSERDKGDIPFEYLGLVQDYNGTDLVQTRKFIEMNCSNYIARFLKSHGWDVASNQPNAVSTTVTNTRTWDNWMEAQRLADLEQSLIDHNNTDVEPTAAASITTTGLSSVNTSSSTPDLSDDELVAFKLKDKNDTSDFATTLTLPKEMVNKKL